MLFTQGGCTAGWAFLVQQGTLVLVDNDIDLARYRAESTEALPTGTVTLAARFAYGGGTDMGKGGTVTLSANGKAIGSGEIPQTAPFRSSLNESQGIGRDKGTPVDNSEQPPCAFMGTIAQLTVALQ